MDAKTLARATFPDYKGRKIRADYSGKVSFYDLNWSGGTRNTYRAVRLADLKTSALPDLAPWCNVIEGNSVSIPPGCAVVEHTIFCGRDCGLRVYFAEAAPMLTPASLCGGDNAR